MTTTQAAEEEHHLIGGQCQPERRHDARRIDSGICHVYGSTVHDEAQMPLGGVKASGWGRFGGHFALQEFTDLRWLTVQECGRDYPI